MKLLTCTIATPDTAKHFANTVKPVLRWLNTVLRAVSGNSREGACFKLDKETWRRKKQWYTEDDFSRSTH